MTSKQRKQLKRHLKNFSGIKYLSKKLDEVNFGRFDKWFKINNKGKRSYEKEIC